MKIPFNQTLRQIEALVNENQPDLLQEICQLLKQEIYHYDWVGFYILDPEKNELILGSYSGKPTEHTRIPVGKGICGQVAEKKQTIIVQDIKQEDNYIACSLDVQSEIVVPVLKDDIFIAELDIDSHSPAPFCEADEQFLTKVCKLITHCFP